MKKFFSLLIIGLFFTAGTVFSQNQLYFGLGGTAMSTWVTNQNTYGLPYEMDYSMTFGGSGNVNIGYEISKNIGVKLEVGYAKLGQNYKDQIGDSVYSRNLKLNYLQIPVLFKYRVGGEVAKFYFLVGPQFNFLLSASQKYLRNGAPEDGTIIVNSKPEVIGEETITDRFESFDIMGRLDVGVDISLMENLFLNAGFTFAYGFTDINASEWRLTYNPNNPYTASHNLYGGFNVGINYRFKP
jgi:hypothetical protein